MSAGLDMSLDDLISKAPKTGGKGKGGSRVAANRKASRPTPYGGGGGRGRGRGGSFGGGRGGGGGIALKSTGANSVYVGNLSWDVTWQDLKDHMKQAGDVVHADVMYEPGSTRSKGCGVVSFANAKGAATAIATLTDTDLKGRMIFVREDREAGNGGGGGGGGAIGAKAGQHSVYVGNLSWDVTWQDLKDHFKSCGAVAHAKIMEGANGRSRGFGIVEFESASDAAAAIEAMNETDLDGRTIHVREDRGDTVRDDAPRGGKGGKGRGRRDEHDDRVDDRRDSGRGEKRGRGDRGDRGPKSAEDLDAEMDRYHGGPENESPNKKAKKAPAKKGPVTQEDLDAEMDAYAAGGAPADAGDA